MTQKKCIFAKKTGMHHQRLSDDDVIRGFRRGDADIIREYFYGYCRAGYCVFDRRYQLSEKQNLDFMSLAHQYAIYLMEHEWKPLEDHSSEVSLKTWLINGFRYVVLDALKWYRREYGSMSFEDYQLSFDIKGDNLRRQFNRMVDDICDHAPLSRQDRTIITMMLVQGFKGKELAEQLGITPSAVSQRYKRLKEEIIVPYFRQYFDMDLDMEEVMDARALVCSEMKESTPDAMAPMAELQMPVDGAFGSMKIISRKQNMETKRTTPEFIEELQPNEIFVFGSNLKGMHGGGAAYIAFRKFGAVMGQGVGLQGRSYAIPTMQGGVETIKPYVDDFIAFAKEHQDLTFLVTRIGCGIAGFTDSEISPLFASAHDEKNIVLPQGW